MDIELVKTKLQEKLPEYGYELYSISYSRQKGDEILSLVLDRVAPIDMNAIVEISNVISSYLDELNIIEEKYTLDISSLGAEKPLNPDKLKDYVGKYVHVHLTNPIEGENIYEGDLLEVNDEAFTLQYRIKTRTKKVSILLSNIYKIRLAIKF
jgi:ribosome maturation factor RimP